MRQLTSFMVASVIGSILACSTNLSERDPRYKESSLQKIDSADTSEYLNKSSLQGAWWSEQDSTKALFFVKGDSLYFTDQQNLPYYLQIKRDSFILNQDSFVRILKIVKLTPDTLKLYDSIIGEELTLFNKICEPCQISVLILIERNGKLTQSDIESFFCSLDSLCSNNIEFSEVSNEFLFELLQNYPEYCLRALDNPQFKSKVPYILRMIESPIEDVIDLNRIYAKIDSLPPEQFHSKENLLKALSIALTNYR